MLNSKMIRILSSLKVEELPRLIEFLESPYFNKKIILTQLCKYLCKIHPEFNESNTNKRTIYNKVYPNKDYNEKHLGYLQSDLIKLILEFLKVENIRKEEFSTSLVSVFAERTLVSLYQKEVKKLKKNLKLTNRKGIDHYWKNFEINDKEDRYFISRNERKDDISAHLASKNLDLFYVSRKLQYFTVLLNRKAMLGKEIIIPSMEFILQYAKQNFDDIPIVNAYYEIIMLQTKEKSLPHFYRLQEIIVNHSREFSKKEIGEIYEEAINYCIQRISYNQEFYINEALKLYSEFLSSGNMYQNGFLSHWKFKNIVKLGLLLNRFEFVETFITTYADKLEPAHKTKALNYNLAELYFAMENYDMAQEYLSKVFLNDLELAYNLGSRMMLIKIFYHKNEMEALLSQIAAFTIYLKRSKNVSNTKKKIYLNFCDLLNKILRQNPKHYAKIKTEIENTKLLTATNWLLNAYQEQMPKAVKKII